MTEQMILEKVIREYQEENKQLREALAEIIDRCDDAMGEWLPVDTVYLPENMQDFRTIARIVTVVLREEE